MKDSQRNPLGELLSNSGPRQNADFAAGSGSAQKTSLLIRHDSLEAAQAEARSSGKLILANFTGSDWCGWCVKLKKDVFSKPEFEAWAKENVVLLELDYPKNRSQRADVKKQNEELASKYAISSYPTVLLLDVDGDVKAKMAYGSNPTEWIQLCESQLNAGRDTRYIADERVSGGSGTKLR
jgi:protein disulfide-isomerase